MEHRTSPKQSARPLTAIVNLFLARRCPISQQDDARIFEHAFNIRVTCRDNQRLHLAQFHKRFCVNNDRRRRRRAKPIGSRSRRHGIYDSKLLSMGNESRKEREKTSSEDALGTQPGAVSLLQATRESDRRLLQGL